MLTVDPAFMMNGWCEVIAPEGAAIARRACGDTVDRVSKVVTKRLLENRDL
jgi:hypothetical protein